MKHLTTEYYLFESIDITYSYEYEYIKQLEGKQGKDKYTSYIYEFLDNNKNKYIVSISIWHFNYYCLTMDFQDYETFLSDNKEKKDILNRTYIQTNRNDGIRVINTVFNILKMFTNQNEFINEIVYTADKKRLTIYKRYFNKLYPNGFINHEVDKGDVFEIFFTIKEK